MKRLLYVLLIMIFWQKGFAQQGSNASQEMQIKEPKSLLSPNVATLGTFCEPNVALYTGAPSISIPLFEVPLQDFVLPITLQYNGTSILVDQPPSWVGLGWNLSAGGVITRQVKDRPDDHQYTNQCYRTIFDPTLNEINTPHDDGFFYSYFALDTLDWDSFKLKGIPDDLYFLSNYAHYYDTEPDEFTFSFLDYHGRFYLNHKGNWEVQCDKSVSVELILPAISSPLPIPQGALMVALQKQPSCFAGFIIKTEDGTQFIFGNDSNAIEFCSDFFAIDQVMIANAWHLTKIVIPNKKAITFSYQRQHFTNQMGLNYMVSSMNDIMDVSGGTPLYFGCYAINYNALGFVTGKLISPVYLHEIRTPSLSIMFYNSVSNDLQYKNDVYTTRLNEHTKKSNPGNIMPYVADFGGHGYDNIPTKNYLDSIRFNLKRYKLDSIVMLAANSYRKVTLNYTEDTTSRLSLREVVLQDNSTYHFEYNHLSDLPDYLSFKTDHWGYFNNTNSKIESLADIYAYESRLTPLANYSMYGLLVKIHHPTGGVTHFEYESNDYQKQVRKLRWTSLEEYQDKRYGGGARIRKISHYKDENDSQPATWKEYYYITNYIGNPNEQKSSGILGERFIYDYTYNEISDNGGPIVRSVFSANSIFPRIGNDLSVCYSEVTEKLSSGGYIVYKFSNYSEHLDEAPCSAKQPEMSAVGNFTSKRAYRGLILSKQEYDEQRQLLHKTTYTYTPNKSTERYVRSVNWEALNLCHPMISSLYFQEGFTYKYYTHTMVPETIRDVLYSANGDSIVKTTKNYYNLQYQMPTQIDVMTKTDTISQTIKYPFDLHPWGIQPYRPYINDFDRLCAKMKNEHYFLPLEVSNYKRGKVVNSAYYNYSEHNGLGQETYYAVDSVSTLGITEPLANFTPVSLFHKDDRYIVPAKQSCKYDAYGNIAEITTDGVPVSYIWGYNHAYVVAKVIGINEAQVLNILSVNQYLQFNSPTGPTLANLTSFQASVNATYPQAQCYTYQYNPLYGIISETDPKGQTLFYDYDAMGRLKEVYYKEDNVKRVVKKYKYHLKDFE